MAHPYIRFRILLARHAVAQLALRLRSSAEIAALLLGPATVGLVAFAAMPAMLAASRPWTLALPLLLLHGLAMGLPFLLLRSQVLPAHTLPWLAGLPVAPRLQLQAAMLVAALLAAPLGLAYAASLAIWLGQHPDWISPARAAGGTVFSFLLSWSSGAWLLARAARIPAPSRRAPALQAATGQTGWETGTAAGHGMLWRRLFWLPLWRTGSHAGPRQAALLAAGLGAMLVWMLGPPWLPRVAGAIAVSILFVLLVHDADTTVRTQVARLAPVTAGWPLRFTRLAWGARAAAQAPALLVLAVLSATGFMVHAWHGGAGKLYLALACLTPPLLAATPPFTPRGRMALVGLAIMLLCAVGSKVAN
ncbi:hypothetical protein SRABI118_03039 [Massilia sp. Bi118]|uniref:hypothetical protein n=1 Tax=Massilia sp. Bi118 TaxID=2822346 RepID=UPI001DD06542|nr:hypothetical protein [Massilia sp. Bi118]CAH0253962.1 hypothetical protein SRABI118_03039 [Massilia sp. Bi118]